MSVNIPQRRGEPIVFDKDEHPRPGTDEEKLAGLKGINGPDKSVTAGNASGVNDGAAALLIGDEEAAKNHPPLARIVGINAQDGVAADNVALVIAFAFAAHKL